jgi:hypothetical protein
MSTNKTTNLLLHSWTGTDYVKRTEFNDNFTKIDTEIQANKDSVTTHLAENEKKERQQDRLLAYHEAWHEIDGRATPNSGKYADLFHDTTKIDTPHAMITSAVLAGGTSITLDNATGFEVGREVTIMDSNTNYEDVLITGISGNTLTVNALVNGYSAQANVFRSNVSIDTVNKIMNFGKLESFSVSIT